MMLSKQLMGEALDLVAITYHKIIKANLTNDTWIPVMMYDNEWITGCEGEQSLVKALECFVNSDNIYIDDKESFQKFADVDDFRKRFKTSKSDAYMIYRRKIGKEYRWVCFGIKPCVTYSDDNQEVMIYIKDIQDIYSDIHNYIKTIEEIGLRDLMTKIRNRHSYDRKLEDIKNCRCTKPITVIYCDVNNLKHTNDTFGHQAGDELILKTANTISEFFKDDEIYRVSGDEFVVISENNLPIKLIRIGLQNILGDHPLFAFGVSSGYNRNITEIISKAEQEMYINKNEYHRN